MLILRKISLGGNYMYNKNKKICLLYASEEHLVTILSSYIYGELNKEEEIITIFERDLEKAAEKILKIIDKSKNINWNKTNINNLNEKLNKDLKGKKIIVFGDNKFINNVNMILDNINEEFEIINCFSILKSEKSINNIIEEYEKILTTEGIEEIKKVITCNI